MEGKGRIQKEGEKGCRKEEGKEDAKVQVCGEETVEKEGKGEEEGHGREGMGREV